ncbi:hypothetical protein PHET_12204, partial [Paragonimus heterotremus]
NRFFRLLAIFSFFLKIYLFLFLFFQACRRQDLDMLTNSELKSPSPVGLPSADDEDASRSWIFKQVPGPWWWCEDCQALVSSPKVTISHLFAVLRQWTPYAQLQLISVVEEVSPTLSVQLPTWNS